MGHPTDPELGTMPCDTHSVVKKDNPNIHLSHKMCTADVHFRINKRAVIHKNISHKLMVLSLIGKPNRMEYSLK